MSANDLFIFNTYTNPLEAEEALEVLQKLNIPYEQSFEKTDDLDDYVGSHPFDTKIVIKFSIKEFSRVEATLKSNSD